MPQSDGYNTLKRFEFEFGGQSYKFRLNPEEFSQDEPSRSTVTQTKGGAWIDDFGGGLEIIFMRGSTGLSNGYNRFKALRRIIRNYRDSTEPGQSPQNELIFHNYTDGESWVVHLDPSGFKLYRSKTNPLLYMYEIRLICMRKASSPQNEQRTEVIIDRDEFDRTADMLAMREAFGPAGIRTGGVVRGLQVPSRLANSASSIGGAGSVVTGIQPRGYLQSFSSETDAYGAIRPHLDLRLSPLGMHYLTQIQNDTYTPAGEFPEGTLGHLVYNKVHNYPVWEKNRDAFDHIMLDLYALTDAYHNHYELFKSRFARTDAIRLIDNIRWLIDELAGADNIVDMEQTPLLHEVSGIFRQVELMLSRMRKDPNLFDIDISAEMAQLETTRGGDRRER